tara:strand:+ start:234 stop:698 length:465 start_codon:yes stop_codon:yes gene_type:complete
MPNLGLANNITSKIENRQLFVLSNIEEAYFNGGTESFLTTDASLLSASKRLTVIAGATNGHAYKQYAVTPGVTYDVSYKWIQVGGGSQSAGVFKLGKTLGATEYGEGEFASGASTATTTFTFLPDSATLFLVLQTNTNGKRTFWDTIVITEKVD